jgi:hypothetical protein
MNVINAEINSARAAIKRKSPTNARRALLFYALKHSI